MEGVKIAHGARLTPRSEYTLPEAAHEGLDAEQVQFERLLEVTLGPVPWLKY